MKFRTPESISRFFYLGFNTKAWSGDEHFGLSIGRFYVGNYGSRSWPLDNPYGWCAGWLDENGCLD